MLSERFTKNETMMFDASANGTVTGVPIKSNKNSWGLVLLACMSVLAVIVIIVGMVYCLTKKARKQKQSKPDETEFILPNINVPYRPPEGLNVLQPEVIQPALEDSISEENLLNPDLYKLNYEECLPGSPYMGPSRLCFSVYYDEYSDKLKVTLIRATRLTPKGTNIIATPYVKICLLPDKRRKIQSRIQQRTSNPEFNEDYVFIVPKAELHTRILKFTVCDFDRFSRQQVIGHVMYPLSDIDFLMSEEKKEIWMTIGEDDSKTTFPKGDLLFCLQFLPTASRLTVAILKARNLQLEGDYGDLYPYVKVSMVLGGKTCKKKKTGISKKSNNPVYNEAFVFTIPPSCLDRVSFIISVINAPRLGGPKKLIGRCIVGPYMYSTGPGLAHWNDMLHSTRSAVAQWHELI